MIIEHARARAEAAFKKKQQARVEGERATTEYHAEKDGTAEGFKIGPG
jgi:hypothetical protein